jgi:hypothetical protein
MERKIDEYKISVIKPKGNEQLEDPNMYGKINS